MSMSARAVSSPSGSSRSAPRAAAEVPPSGSVRSTARTGTDLSLFEVSASHIIKDLSNRFSKIKSDLTEIFKRYIQKKILSDEDEISLNNISELINASDKEGNTLLHLALKKHIDRYNKREVESGVGIFIFVVL